MADLYPIKYVDENTGYCALEITEPIAKEIRKVLNIGIKEGSATLEGAGDYDLTGDILQYTKLHVNGDKVNKLGALTITANGTYSPCSTVTADGVTTYNLHETVISAVPFTSFVTEDSIIPTDKYDSANCAIQLTTVVKDATVGSTEAVTKVTSINLQNYVKNHEDDVLAACGIHKAENFNEAVERSGHAENITVDIANSRIDVDFTTTFKLSDGTTSLNTDYTVAVENINLYNQIVAALDAAGYEIVAK